MAGPGAPRVPGTWQVLGKQHQQSAVRQQGGPPHPRHLLQDPWWLHLASSCREGLGLPRLTPGARGQGQRGEGSEGPE